MTKYNFDYYAKRAEVLTEMAMPSPWIKPEMGEAGPVIKNIFDGVGKVMSKGGEVDGQFVPGMGGNRHVNRALRYIIFLLSGIDETADGDEVSDVEANQEIVSAACNILGIPKEGWRTLKDENGVVRFKDPDKLYRAAIAKSIKDNASTILSPEFKQKALDQNNILNYVSNNRITNASSYHAGERRSERHGGMSPEEIDSAQTSIKDLLTKIHKAQFYKRKKKNPELAQKEEAGGAEISNGFIDNAFLVTDAIEVVLDNAQTVQETVKAQMDKFKTKDPETLKFVLNDVKDKLGYPLDYITNLYFSNIPLLQALYKKYSELHATGVDLESFKGKMEKFKANSPDLSETIELILSEIGELESILKTNIEEPVVKAGPFSQFSQYDPEILEMFLKTPQDLENFKKFYKWLLNEMIGKANKKQEEIDSIKWGEAEVPGEKEQMRRGFQGFLDRRPQLKKQQHADMNTTQKDLGVAPKPKQQQPQPKFPGSLQPRKAPREEDEETVEESTVMHYMTEQVSKDRFQTKGEFKERGCKKLNYHDWIVKYQ